MATHGPPFDLEALGAKVGWTPTIRPELLQREHAGFVGAAHHFEPLLAKLLLGHPITMLVMGSSIVGTMGGCTAPAPMLGAGCQCPKCCGTACGYFQDHGWARQLLESVNRTWPHAQHRLYNLGVPGGSLIPSAVACPLTYLNFDVDVVVFDFLTIVQPPIIDRLLRTLLSRSPRPLLLWAEFSVDLVDTATGHNANGRACAGGALRPTSQTVTAAIRSRSTRIAS